MTLERRHDRRYALDRPVKLQCDQTGLRYLTGHTVNISSGGAMITIDHPQHLQLGQAIRVTIAHQPDQPMLADEDAVTGTIIRCLGCADRQHVAISFNTPHRIAEAG